MQEVQRKLEAARNEKWGLKRRTGEKIQKNKVLQ